MLNKEQKITLVLYHKSKLKLILIKLTHLHKHKVNRNQSNREYRSDYGFWAFFTASQFNYCGIIFSFTSPISLKQSTTLMKLVLVEVYFSKIKFCLDLFSQMQILPHLFSR